MSQWVTGHLTLCQALSTIGQQAEANQLMTDCVSQYTGSAEEARYCIIVIIVIIIHSLFFIFYA